MTPLEGQTIGSYQVLEQVGVGGMGTVYKARQPLLDRFVALKVLSPRLADDPEYVARFRREAAAAAKLNHPGIVSLFDAGEQAGVHFIAMEFINGETLESRLERHGRLDPAQAVAICAHVATALRYAWDKAQVIHRDIKPENIFLCVDGQVKLCDLGLARFAVNDTKQRITRVGTAWGTPQYMSPEQVTGKQPLDYRSDMYGLGCTLFRMLSGAPPYDGLDPIEVMKCHADETDLDVLERLPECPNPLARVLAKMLAKRREDRHQTYDELIEDLRECHETISPTASKLELWAPESAPLWKQPRIQMGFGIAVIVFSIVGSMLLWTAHNQRPKPNPTHSKNLPARVATLPVSESKRKAAVHSRASISPSTNAVPLSSSISTNRTTSAALASLPATTAKVPQAISAAIPTVPTVAKKAVVDAAFIAAVALLPAEAQVQTVSAKLKELNPDFDGELVPGIESNRLTSLSFSSAGVADISPLKALPTLQNLSCPGTSEKRSLTDLTSLTGLPLSSLDCSFSSITDLTALRGMPLAALSCHDSLLTNLAVLAELPLRNLVCDVKTERDRESLWKIKTLETINGRTAAQYWHEVGPPRDDFAKSISLLSATQQVAQVVRRLRELNPLFDGRVAFKTASNKVVELSMSTATVNDISPLAALPALQRLWLVPSGDTNVVGQLSDLSPLRGMWLGALWCQNNPVSDLSPLRGQPLKILSCGRSQLSDISPLLGMPLTVLSVDNTEVRDLSPAAEASLQTLWCQNSKVTDLSVLTNMPLRELKCDLVQERDEAILKAIPTLQKINGETASMFWLRTASPSAKAKPRTPTKPARLDAGLNGRQLLQKFTSRLKEANPSFKTAVEPVYDGEKLSGVAFASDFVSDLSPVRELPDLKQLRCVGTSGQSPLVSLSSLSGLPLQSLDCTGNRITDLTPLKTTALASLIVDGNPVSDLKGLEGLRLTSLSCARTAVADLGPLRRMKLSSIALDGTKVSDLSPLRGMPIGALSFDGTAVTSITPLKGMPLSSLSMAGARISDLTPIRECPISSLIIDGTLVTTLSVLHEMPLAVISFANTRVSDLTPLRDRGLVSVQMNGTDVKDLSPLRRMPITLLAIHNTKVTDLSALRTMALTTLKANFKLERDGAILSSIKTLITINDLPAAEFWKQAEAGKVSLPK